MDNNGQSKGFGFVNFERPEMAKNVSDEDICVYCLVVGNSFRLWRN
jgi:hypothetical protein